MHRGFVGSYAFSAVRQEGHPEQAVWQQFDPWMTLKTVNLIVVTEKWISSRRSKQAVTVP